VAKKPYWLDIGAGSNILIKEQPGATLAVGIDIEKHENAFYDGETSSFCLASAYDLPFKDGSFEFITSRYTFEHLESPERALEEAGRVLKPDGLLVMQTTNKANPLVFISRLIPFSLKKRIFKRMFRDNPSGTFKTHYRINRPSAIKSNYGPLILERLITVEDPLCQSPLVYFFSMLIFRMIRFFRLESLKGNMIILFRKRI
jgi:ubiquinone/menaquinone biosynthesis C-methylase UbiE